MRARVQATVIVCALCVAQSIIAQTYPTRPIRMVVASSPGGGSDILARLVSPKLGDALGQQVIVENRAARAGSSGLTWSPNLLLTDIR
jgi:tripartite-type tricarboxylate transporter receptor subunit TctC